ncbi:MAG: mandelate racemase [Elusimicrobia bacterium]|nr:mandelate racemase [Elusimicrobiota bacterium]
MSLRRSAPRLQPPWDSHRRIAPVEKLSLSYFDIPADFPESDATLSWERNGVVVVELFAGGERGLGYTYGDAAIGQFIRDRLADVVIGIDAADIPFAYASMRGAVREMGVPGLAAMAISALDIALWDLKARLMGAPLSRLLGCVRSRVPVYGSGGYCSYSLDQLRQQLGGWAAHGISKVKMKVGRHPRDDQERVRAAREAIGRGVELFVDADGAYTAKQALAMAETFRAEGVTWFEEPVAFQDLEGLALVRARAPAGMDIVAGERGWDPMFFRRLIEAGSVDVVQADVTRCGGISGLMRVSALCEAFGLPMSAHGALAVHLHVACGIGPMRHIEFLHDHSRIESILFEGVPAPVGGFLRPDNSRLGLGLELKREDISSFHVAEL